MATYRSFITIFVVAGFPILFGACRNPLQNGPVAVKQEGITVTRYEKALFAIDPERVKQELPKMIPEFSFFLGDNWQDTMNLRRIKNYLRDPNIRELYSRVITRFPDTGYFRNDIDKLIRKVQEYYPDKKISHVYTYVSGLDLDVPVFITDTVMVIALDLFLGDTEPAYDKAGIPGYIQNRLQPENLLPACVNAFADSVVKLDEDNQSLLDLMVAAGKRYYLMDIMIPDTREDHKVGYTLEKLRWCRENEANIWAFLVGNQLLYTHDPRIISKMMADAPFTSGFSEQSPGRLGDWLGWQIVKAYIKNNPGVSLQELLRNTKGQEILQASKYKPDK